MNYAAARRLRLKVEQRCLSCTAGLQDDDGAFCVECTERATLSKQRHYARNVETLRAKCRDAKLAAYRANPEKLRERQRRYRLERKLAGLCVSCSEPAIDTNECGACRARMAERKRAYHERQRLGVISAARPGRPRVSTRPAMPTVSRVVDASYSPLDEQKPRARLMLAMRWHEWITVNELFGLIGVVFTEDDHRAWDAHMAVMSREVRRGAMERRGRPGAYEYRLTATARDEVDAMRRQLQGSTMSLSSPRRVVGKVIKRWPADEFARLTITEEGK